MGKFLKRAGLGLLGDGTFRVFFSSSFPCLFLRFVNFLIAIGLFFVVFCGHCLLLLAVFLGGDQKAVLSRILRRGRLGR